MNYMFQVDLLDGVLDYSEQGLNSLNESAASPAKYVLENPIHPTTKWLRAQPKAFTAVPPRGHCDGTPLLPTDCRPMFRLQGPAASIAWSANQDINFDGQIRASLPGLPTIGPASSCGRSALRATISGLVVRPGSADKPDSGDKQGLADRPGLADRLGSAESERSLPRR